MRGMEVIDMEVSLSVLVSVVSEAILGWIFTMIREPVDNFGPIDTPAHLPFEDVRVLLNR